MSSENIEIESMRAELAVISARLDLLEGKAAAHPSFKTFTIDGTDENEKACAFEPNDRPCDHCSMCTARGF